MKQILTFGFLMFGFILQSQAQEVLTKINGGASWAHEVVSPETITSVDKTLTELDYMVIVSGPIVPSDPLPTITLPSASSVVKGRMFRIVRYNSGSGAISQYITNTGATSTNYTSGNVLLLQSDGSNWLQVN